MSDGTCLPRFKRAFIAALAGIPNVSYESPTQPEDHFGEDGSGATCWFADQATGTLDITIVGDGALWVDETWQVPFHIQVLGKDTDDDQETVDQAACELLGDVMQSFSDPSFGVTDDSIQMFAALPVGAEPWYAGVQGNNLRAAAYELTIELRARLVIGS